MNTFEKLLIIFGGFISYALADGYTYSMGVFYSYFLDAFETSSVAAATLPGLIYAMPQLSALFLCPILDNYGFSSGSAWASSFASNFGILYLTLGIITSLGLQLTYSSALMAIIALFEDSPWFGLAIGITMCGSGIGSFVSNQFFVYLLQFWSWREVLLIESAIMLNVMVSAACIHFLDAERSKRLNKCLSTPSLNSNCHDQSSVDVVYNESENVTVLVSRPNRLNCLSDSIRYCLCIPSLYRFASETSPNTNNYRLSLRNTKVCHALCSSLSKLFSKELWSNSSFLVFVLANGINGAGMIVPWTFLFDYVQSVLADLYAEHAIKEFDVKQISWLPSLIGFGLLVGYILFGLCTSQFGNCKSCQPSTDSSQNIVDTDQQLSASQLSLKLRIQKAKQYRFHLILYLSLLLADGCVSMAIALIPINQLHDLSHPTFSLYSHKEGLWLAAMCLLIGIIYGGFFVVYAPLLIDIVGLKLWPSALGVYLAVNGLTNLAGTNIGGYIHDSSGSYKWTFIFAGVMPLAAFVCIVVEKTLKTLIVSQRNENI